MRQTYDQIQPVYDKRHARFLGWSGASAQSALEGALLASIRPGYHVLDAGCGTAHVAQRALEAEPSARFVLLDSSPNMLRAAQSIQARRVHGDMHALPFENSKFDLCLSAWSLEPLQEPGVAISELLRVTRSGGTLLLAFCSNAGGGIADLAVQAVMSARGLGKPLAAGRVAHHLQACGAATVRRLPAHGRTVALIARKGVSE